jgi:hypothetical protein
VLILSAPASGGNRALNAALASHGSQVRKSHYELICGACGGQFSFGQHKKGGSLFPKRKGDNGFLPNRGWHKWDGDIPF